MLAGCSVTQALCSDPRAGTWDQIDRKPSFSSIIPALPSRGCGRRGRGHGRRSRGRGRRSRCDARVHTYTHAHAHRELDRHRAGTSRYARVECKRVRPHWLRPQRPGATPISCHAAVCGGRSPHHSPVVVAAVVVATATGRIIDVAAMNVCGEHPTTAKQHQPSTTVNDGP